VKVLARFGVPAVLYIYLSAMVLRYILRMSFYPDQRWFGGTIPIFFHWVLAAFLLVVAGFHRKTSAAQAGVPGNLQQNQST